MCHDKSASPRRGGVTVLLYVLTFRCICHPNSIPHPDFPGAPSTPVVHRRTEQGHAIAYRAVTTCKCPLFSDGRFSRIMSTRPIYYSLTELYIQYAGSIECKITQICVLLKHISVVYTTLHCSYKNRGKFAGMLI